MLKCAGVVIIYYFNYTFLNRERARPTVKKKKKKKEDDSILFNGLI